MIGDLFDSPWKILIVAVVLIVLFGSAKLPMAARSLGKSMRILKAEVKDLHEDDETEPGTRQLATAQQQLAAQREAQHVEAQHVEAQHLEAQHLEAQRAQQQIDALERKLADLKQPAAHATQSTQQP